VNSNVIRSNTIYSNGLYGIIITSGSDNQADNNDVWGNSGGIRADYGVLGTYIGKNTIHGNPSFGISIGAGSYNALLEVNNIYDTDGQAIEDYGVGTLILP
jgi:parallel beta-helix repeat protein